MGRYGNHYCGALLVGLNCVWLYFKQTPNTPQPNMDVPIPVYLIRHAEAAHNVAAKQLGDAAYDMPEYWNAGLTTYGRKQAAEAVAATAAGCLATRIVVSPLRRALETAAIMYQDRSLEINDLVTEGNPAWPCNRREGLKDLEAQWGGRHTIVCSAETPTWSETHEAVCIRAATFFVTVKEPTVIVSHSDFIRAALHVAGVEDWATRDVKHCVPILIHLRRDGHDDHMHDPV
jgi:broad specificity phosphatase PhoE